MRTTGSKLATNWDGFRPVVYSLSEKALNLSLTATKGHGDQQTEEETSIAKLLERLGNCDYHVEDALIAVNITTEGGTLRLRGPSFNCKLAGIILESQREGIKPFASEWFWYDADGSNTDPTISYSFFVASEDRIVLESVSFLDYPDSGFDPGVFDCGDDDTSDSDWSLARAAYWYRRFYRETKIGQLIVLRPSMPVLHYYPDGRPRYKMTASVPNNGLLRNIRFLLWVVTALLAMITFLLIER